MRTLLWTTVALFALAPGAQAAEPKYRKEISAFIARSLDAEAMRRLEKAAASFNALAADTKAERLHAIGLKDAELAELKEKFGEVELKGAKAEYADGRLAILAGADRIEIHANDYLAGRLLVNGKAFTWNAKQSFAKNVDAYAKLFKKEEHSWLDSLLPSAYAEAQFHFSVQMAGLVLHFLVDAERDSAGLLVRLGEKVKEELGACLAMSPQEYGDHNLTKAVEAATVVNDILTGRTAHFASCSDVADFVSLRSSSPTQQPSLVQVPADLCASLSSLALCVRKKFPSAAQSQDQKKRLREAPGDEWKGEPAPPGAAGQGK